MGDKRKDYISWDEYFMGIATLSGMRSKDPNTQVGACIVSQDNKILSMGYNGLPRFMLHFFHVTNVLRQLFRQELRLLYMTVTNMQILHL